MLCTDAIGKSSSIIKLWVEMIPLKCKCVCGPIPIIHHFVNVAEFRQGHYPDSLTMEKLAAEMNLSEGTIKVMRVGMSGRQTPVNGHFFSNQNVLPEPIAFVVFTPHAGSQSDCISSSPMLI